MLPNQLESHLAGLRQLLVTAVQRLGDPDDIESLHEVRVVLRRLRMLLRPLGPSAQRQQLLEAAATLFRQTNAMRDDEVLLAELLSHEPQGAFAHRREQQAVARQALLASPALAALMMVWPDTGAVAVDGLEPSSARRQRHLKKQMRRSVASARRNLCRQLRQESPDLHVVRLAIKRLRYRLQAGKRTPPHLLALLEQGQEMLGAWHDHDVWRVRAETETDLQPCAARWHREQAVLEACWLPLREGLRLALQQRR